MIVYGSRVSYFTGKLEAYLRYKNIPYTLKGMPYDKAKMLKEKVGSIQMPIVDREDGRWMSDSTPILNALEQEHPNESITPDAPAVAFIASLIEDYGDEWLWRPAMHYRWSYRHSRELLSNILVDEITVSVPFPRFMVRRMIRHRQRKFFTRRDGVSDKTRSHVEQGYRNALDYMSAMLKDRPFMLGDLPSRADFGLMGPMFRHFSQDPDPAEIMRTHAPLVYAWVARMWAAKTPDSGGFVATVPDDAAPLLKEICETHLQQLAANARAYADDRTAFEMSVQGCDYAKMPVSRYRVYCLEKLREQFAALPTKAQTQVRTLLPHSEAAILWMDDAIAKSDYDVENRLPYGHAINVYGTGTP